MPRHTRALLMLAVGSILVAALVACAPPEPPNPVNTGAVDEARDTAQDAEGAAAASLVDTKCSMCHTLDLVNNATYDKATWTSTIERMERNGLVITEEEKSAIIEYLSGRSR